MRLNVLAYSLVTVSISSVVSAGVVFQDTFTSGTTLNGRSPDTVNVYGSQWSVHASTSSSDTSAMTTSLGAATPTVSGGKINFYGQNGTSSANGNVLAVVAYTPTSSSATLSLTVTINSIQGSWSGFGFTTENPTNADPWHVASTPWAFVSSKTKSDGTANSSAGQVALEKYGVTSFGSSSAPYLSEGEHVITLTYNGSTKAVSLYVDGSTTAYLTGTLSSSINITGFFLVSRSNQTATDITTATFDNVTLDDSGYTVPEPASLGLLSVAGFALLKRK